MAGPPQPGGSAAAQTLQVCVFNEGGGWQLAQQAGVGEDGRKMVVPYTCWGGLTPKALRPAASADWDIDEDEEVGVSMSGK